MVVSVFFLLCAGTICVSGSHWRLSWSAFLASFLGLLSWSALYSHCLYYSVPLLALSLGPFWVVAACLSAFLWGCRGDRSVRKWSVPCSLNGTMDEVGVLEQPSSWMFACWLARVYEAGGERNGGLLLHGGPRELGFPSGGLSFNSRFSLCCSRLCFRVPLTLWERGVGLREFGSRAGFVACRVWWMG